MKHQIIGEFALPWPVPYIGYFGKLTGVFKRALRDFLTGHKPCGREEIMRYMVAKSRNTPKRTRWTPQR
jgi:hypothetical protein